VVHRRNYVYIKMQYLFERNIQKEQKFVENDKFKKKIIENDKFKNIFSIVFKSYCIYLPKIQNVLPSYCIL